MFSTRLRRMRFVHVFFVLCFSIQFAQAQPPENQANGSSNVSATVPTGKLLLSGVTDVIFPEWTGDGGQTKTVGGICIWSTIRQYSLTITNKAVGVDAFVLASGATTDTIPFTITWTDSTSGTADQPVTHGTKLSALQAPSTTKDCSDIGTQASMTIAMTDAALAAARAGTYTAALNLLVIAE